jgi:hypothetical protein
MKRMSLLLAVLAVVAVVAGCSSISNDVHTISTSPPATGGTTTTPPPGVTTTTGGEDVPTTSGEDGRSSAKPLAVGTTAVVGTWSVTVKEIKTDATAAVKAANQFNDDPTKGRYMTVTFEAENRGTKEAAPSSSIVVALVGSDKVQYKDFECHAVAGPTNFSTLEPGGKTTLVDCLDVPPAAIAGGVVFVEDQLSFGEANNRVYWKIG